MKPFKLVASVALSLLAGAIGSLATIPNIPTWYAELAKPWFNPPNWIFGPVWSALYILMGISLYLVWAKSSARSKTNAYRLFGTQLILNALWSIVFFGFHAPLAGIGVIVALLVTIVLTVKEFVSFSQLAGVLLIPYVAWVCFATCLNVAIAALN